MPLVSMKEILKDAAEKKYAVGCYNTVNLEMARGVVEAAEEEKSPVILCHAEVHFKYTSLERIAPIMLEEAKTSKVPVAVLLDHGKSFSAVIKAMHYGFNAVMYDGSSLSYEDNLKNTAEIVKIARELNVSVEAELGHVARPKSAGADGDEDDSIIDDKSLYTDPFQAEEFVLKTGVDALAIAFGTAHGVYLKKPLLDFQRLSAIRKAVDVPLVMHGGSGLADKDFSNSIMRGICKINYYTGMAQKSAQGIRDKLNSSKDMFFYHNILVWSIQEIKKDVQNTMRLFGSSNRI